MRLVLVLLVAATATASAESRMKYQRRGDYELGLGVSAMLSPDVYNVTATPVFGWVIANGVELSTIASVATVRSDDARATLYSAIVEPSYHAPLSKTVWSFIGMGIGTAWAKELGTQVIVAPRIGVNLLVGRRGAVTPAIAYRFVTHGTIDAADDDAATRALTRALQLEVGYSFRW
ncbi:MAG TPA: hypothetical protein VGM90_36185 [Kofleriaceae bacterium]